MDATRSLLIRQMIVGEPERRDDERSEAARSSATGLLRIEEPPADLPRAVWINPPAKKSTAQDGPGSTIAASHDLRATGFPTRSIGRTPLASEAPRL